MLDSPVLVITREDSKAAGSGANSPCLGGSLVSGEKHGTSRYRTPGALW